MTIAVPAWAQKPAAPKTKFDTVAPAAPSRQTLIDVLIATYNTNPTIEAQRASLRGSNEELPQALSNWRPTITINESISAAEILSNPAIGPTTRSDSVDQSASVNFSQPLFRGFRTLNQTERARNNIAAARAVLHGVEQNILLAAVEAYTAIVRDTAVVELNRNNERVLERQFDAATNRFEVGELTRTDIAQSEARLSRATSDRISVEGNLVASRSTYKRVVGVA
ncbi:MAG: TolC family protein, partial [Alphaproteobacteria bacterium]|nr:TolC family protein [Alphaproteobacteria bacterium]